MKTTFLRLHIILCVNGTTAILFPMGCNWIGADFQSQQTQALLSQTQQPTNAQSAVRLIARRHLLLRAFVKHELINPLLISFEWKVTELIGTSVVRRTHFRGRRREGKGPSIVQIDRLFPHSPLGCSKKHKSPLGWSCGVSRLSNFIVVWEKICWTTRQMSK